MIVPEDDSVTPRRFRMPAWLYHTLLVFIVLVLLAPIVYIAIYYDVLVKAANANRLAEENESLRRYQYKVQVLEQSLMETRQLMAQITSIAGLDSVFVSGMYGSDDDQPSLDTRMSPGSISRTLPHDSPIPDGLPVTGWISRGYSDIPGKKHKGIDLAIPEGTAVYSTAFGIVKFAGNDPVYGQTVIIRNSDTISTIYGHNSQLMVQTGDTVFAGQRLALSGNTGKSSAPHLHYEIRVNDNAINPIKYFVYED
jgi:murein DD-endopeptidase MepM/ murein hydrolase activator NlpD